MRIWKNQEGVNSSNTKLSPPLCRRVFFAIYSNKAQPKRFGATPPVLEVSQMQTGQNFGSELFFLDSF